jgi:hypothetical protein
MISLPDMWWGYTGSPDMPECGEIRSLMGSRGTARAQESPFLGPEPVLGVSRRDIQNRHGRLLNSQHCASWSGPSSSLRQARELISWPSLGNRAKILSFTRTQSRVVTGLLTGHNTLRRHLFLMGLVNNSVCRGCGVKEETSAHVLCECEAWASLRHTHLGSYFLEPEDIKSISLGAIGSFGKAAELS